MKKRFILSILTIMAIVLPIAVFRLDASAERSYYISSYKILINVNTNGSADFREELTYNYSGSFNGILRDVDFSKSGGIEDPKVYLDVDGNLTEFSRNNNNPENGEPGTYNLVTEGSVARFKVFEPSQDEEKKFVLEYRMKDAVTVYSDTAEFKRQPIGQASRMDIRNVYTKIILPEGAAKDELKVFAHGPLTGVSGIADGRTLEFSVPRLSPGDMFEALVLFPVRLVPQATNKVDMAALPGILDSEGKKAEEANKQREEARQQVREYEQRQAQQKTHERELSRIGEGLALALFILWFPLLIYIYLKYDRELKHRFEGKYYRELPGEYTPAEMTVLMTMGSVNSRDIMATLMDLVRKKQLVLTSGKSVKSGFFGSKEIDDYIIRLNDKAPAARLKKHEAFLISWFTGKIGDGASVSLEEIREYVKSRSEALRFKADYDHWVSLVKEEAGKNDFFDKTGTTGKIIGVLSGVGFFGAGFALVFAMFYLPAMILSLMGAVMIIFGARIRRRTAYGNEQHAMWHAFRNFLRDFSRLDKAEIPSIVLWEHYLVYAVSLGVAKEVIRQLPLVFTDADLDDSRLTYLYGASYGYFAGFTTVFDNTVSTVESAISSAVSIANSASSSSSGGGGGFSGGSSGGGGGGGGAGAF